MVYLGGPRRRGASARPAGDIAVALVLAVAELADAAPRRCSSARSRSHCFR